MLKLQCVAQNYDWGIKGGASTVGRLYALSSGAAAEAEKPYAEFWMGTHPSGPSHVLADDGAVLLKDFIASNPGVLGDKVNQIWPATLPFLFKVLSVAKALSIQAHPDKKLAEQLHASQPKNYKDDNHKPEMALAVTPFEALCAFVTADELREALKTVPELQTVVGEAESKAILDAAGSAAEAEKAAFKGAFKGLMTRDPAVVAESLAKLIARLEAEKATRALTPKEELILRIEKQYPGDVGVFCPYFLNYLMLQPGEAIYLAANEPHAYLSGECVECMAASDNVVRAGLTPKYRDVDNLCSMLTYNQGPPEVLTGTKLDEFTSVYTPPFDEFEVERSVVPLGKTAKLPTLPGPSVLLAFKGDGAISLTAGGESKVVALKGGEVYFVPAGVGLEVSAVVESEGAEKSEPELHLYRARVNAKVLGA